ncbi:predicted protein [Naegleria gruberi]|uniref:Predicted protein n=1 Tax=Naegleria gruberi TaxID=5762 RepID=D2VZA8_NAEGR|nr:uncharacterized protein NAEGRDRAFT_74425 [Naegleria gruberi]EFC37759.1 predicted protein [Naegleria gruberi]|eukprot:XP_002670503.1 predicted protein [Naegleria gruberi strain NEG-M]
MSFSFGTTSNQNKPATTGFNFGTTNNTGTTGGTSTGFNFGAPTTTANTQPTTGFNFGTTNTQPTQPTTGTTGSTGFNFGTTGTATNTQPTQPTTGFNFGTTNTVANTNTGFNLGTPTNNPIDNSFKIIELKYKSSTDTPDNPYCKFIHFFYNVVDDGKQQATLEALTRKYARSINPELWRQAMEKNPDPSRLVPIPATSFKDVKDRVEKQQKRIELMNDFLKVLDSKISECKTKHEADTMSRIGGIKQRHTDLSHRILKIQSKLEVLTQSGIGIRNEDISLRNKLNTLQRELHKPNQFRGRLIELSPQVNYYLQQSNLLLNNNTLDDETKENVKNFLEQQTNGLNELLSILKKDIKDINYIKQQVSADKQKRSINY